MIRVATLGIGALFGFVLSRGRATDYDAITGMFRFKDPHVALLMASAIGVAMLGLWLLRRSGAKALDGQPVALPQKPMHLGVVVGGAIFGIGWGITGQCPGTAVGQIGEGKVMALLTVGGMLVGTWLYALAAPKLAFLTRRAPPNASSVDASVAPANG